MTKYGQWQQDNLGLARFVLPKLKLDAMSTQITNECKICVGVNQNVREFLEACEIQSHEIIEYSRRSR